MSSRSRFHIDTIQKRIVFYIVVITIPVFLITLYLVQNMVSRQLTQSESRQAKLINMNTMKNIQEFLNETSRFTVKAANMITADPRHYDMVFPLLQQNIRNDSALFGSALALDPDGPLKKTYCQYFYRSGDSVRQKWLMPPNYNYLQSDWYKKAKETNRSVWSEPYFDKGGGEVFMSTFSYPVFDLKKRFLGVVTADVELNTLSQKIQRLSRENNEFIFLVSQKGFLLSHPSQQFNLKQTIFNYATYLHSDTLKKAAQDMMRGKSGVYRVRLKDGKYTLYTMYIGQTSWSVGIFLKDSVLFRPLNQLKLYLLLMMVVDIILILILVLIIAKQLKKTAAEEARVKNEFLMASRIQQQFLPKKEEVDAGRYNLSGLMLPAREVGGDFYGYHEHEDQLIFYVGDVSGKGVPASLFMMASQMLIQDAIEEHGEPARILEIVNRKLSQISTTGMFATLMVGVVDWQAGTLTFSSAGHPPFLIWSHGGVYSPFAAFAPPVAVFEDQQYHNEVVPLEQDTLIVAYSDGVSEAENKQKELYGTYRLAKVVQASGAVNSQELKSKILQDVKKFTAGQAQNDDLTLVVVRLH